MSIWGCKDCGALTGGSRGTPQCCGCGSYQVGRVEFGPAGGSPEWKTTSGSYTAPTVPSQPESPPTEDVDNPYWVATHAYAWTLDEDGTVWGLVQGDQGYAPTHIIIPIEDILNLADMVRDPKV